MGGMSEWHIQMQEEKLTEWIQERLGDPDADESTSGWVEAERDYQLMQEAIAEEAYQAYKEELDWFYGHAYSDLHHGFQIKLDKLLKLSHDTSPTLVDTDLHYKMTYGYAVTLMESFLSDSVKSLITKNDFCFERSLNEVDEVKKAKFSLSNVHQHPGGIKGMVLDILSEVLYHNIPKVIRILESITNKRMDIDQSKVTKIVSLRHDIVHRDGKTTTGETIDISQEDLVEAISEIKKFVHGISMIIDAPSATLLTSN